MEIDDSFDGSHFKRESLYQYTFVQQFSSASRKRKQDNYEDEFIDDEEELCPPTKVHKSNKFPTTMELQEMIQNWNINPNVNIQLPLQTRKPNWQKIQEEIARVLAQVDTKRISDMISRDRFEIGDSWRDDKQLFLYYKELFKPWCTSSNTKRLGHIHIGTAIHIWALLLKDRCFFFDTWVAFLLEKGILYISRDTWNLFFEFCAEFNTKTFANYNFEGRKYFACLM